METTRSNKRMREDCSVRHNSISQREYTLRIYCGENILDLIMLSNFGSEFYPNVALYFELTSGDTCARLYKGDYDDTLNFPQYGYIELNQTFTDSNYAEVLTKFVYENTSPKKY